MAHDGTTSGRTPRDGDTLGNSGSSASDMRQQLIGLGDRSMRKTHFPELRRRLDQLERFRSLLDEVNDLIILADVDTGGIMDVAGNIGILGHCCEDDLVGGNLDGLLHKDAAEELRRNFASGRSGPWTCNTGLNCRGMCIVPVELTAKVASFGGQPYALLVARDVRERMRVEEALRRSEERYRTIADHNYDMECWLSPKGDMVYVSPSSLRVTGYSPETFMADTVFLDGIIHPDDYTAWRRHMNGMAEYGNQDGESVDFRLVRADAEEVWISQATRLVSGSDGKSLGLRFSLRDITSRKRMEEQLTYQSLHDSLTALANRNLCLDRVGQAMGRARRRAGYHFAVAFMNMDRFKVVNESMGHAAGDNLLREVARRLDQELRDLDTVARFGGDEFVLLLEELESPAEAVRIVRRLRDAMAEPFLVSGRTIQTGASFGILLTPDPEGRPEDLLRDANIAMHRAKEAGGGKMKVFNRRMLEHAVQIMTMEGDLRLAVNRNEFFVAYQPIVRLSDGRPAGFEALVRWQHPERGVVPPLEFISLAEETGLILPLGRMVLEQACRDMARWRVDMPSAEPLFMSVNLSPKQFSEPGLASMVAQALDFAGLPPERLKLEITESAIMDDPHRAIEALGRLKAMGVRLSVDDFGTGYSSLSYLQRFPLDYLKVDLSFVRNIHISQEDHEIARAIVGLAHSLGLETISEGVETIRHRDILRALGSEYGQGYLFSRPVPAAEVPGLLAHGVLPPVDPDLSCDASAD